MPAERVSPTPSQAHPLNPSATVTRQRDASRSLRGLLVLIMLLSPGLATIPVASAAASDGAKEAVDQALVWIETRTMRTGATNTADTTHWAILAIGSADRTPWTWIGKYSALTPCDFLRDNPDAYATRAATAWALLVMAVVTCGEDPRTFGGTDWLAKLESFHTDGPPGTTYRQIGNPNAWNDDMFATLAFAAAGATDTDAYRDALEEVKRKQRADGGWTCCAANQASDPEMTAAALMALMAGGGVPGDIAIQRGVLYLDNQQDIDGSFPAESSKVRATAWVLMALHAVKENPEDGRWRTATGATPVSYLRGSQLSSGAFPLNRGELNAQLLATLEATLALSGNPMPVNVRIPAGVSWTPTLPKTLDPVTFTETKQAGGAASYSWSFPEGKATGATVTHSFRSTGLQPVTVTVRDDARGLARVHGQVDVLNRPPNASLEILPNVTARGRDVVVEVKGTDLDGVVERVRYDFGDGTVTDWTDDFRMRHKYTRLGTFLVAVTVRDNIGATATASREVRIINLPPTVDVGPAVVGNRSAPVILFAKDLADPEGQPVTVHWDLGDGNTSTARIVDHRYERLGTYHVRFTARDAEGGETRANVNVTIRNLAPVVTRFQSDRDAGVIGDTFTFTVAAHDPDGAGIAKVLYNYGDAGLTYSTLPYHAYTANGTYAVAAEVTDVDGGRTTVERTIIVGDGRSAPEPMRDPAPVIARVIHEPERPKAGQNVTLRAVVTDNGNVTSTTLRWRTPEVARSHEFPHGGNLTFTIGPFARGDVVDWWVEAMDDAGNRAESPRVSFAVAARVRPAAVGTISTTEVLSGSPVSLDLSTSRAGDSAPVGYRIDWGDGSAITWTERTVESHAYARPGVFTVTAHVRDHDGDESDPWTSQVLVMNRAPVVRVRSPPDGYVALGSFRATGTATDPDGTLTRISATLDGHPIKIDGGATWAVTVNVDPLAPGPHELRVTAADDSGATGDAAVLAFTVPDLTTTPTRPSGNGSGAGDDRAPSAPSKGAGEAPKESPPASLIIGILGACAVAVVTRRRLA